MNYSTPSGKAARTIRSILADRRESVESLAENTGISLSTLKRRLLLSHPFTIDELGLIASYFEVSIIDVLTPIGERDGAERLAEETAS
ncbi:helix-turn-helix transcriptional regulator [Microbacterium oxydans]|uniref:helix-turn-helix domain-containing protein n=1 Tax=Microbacterium oxydans TaxID=82380 RepID=UPI0033303B86|nr:helix-turn-helix domain-containing protein [Microbacterium oxydans]